MISVRKVPSKALDFGWIQQNQCSYDIKPGHIIPSIFPTSVNCQIETLLPVDCDLSIMILKTKEPST